MLFPLSFSPSTFTEAAEEDPWRRKWQPTPVFLPGESQGQRSLVGYSRWGRKQSDTTEQLSTAHIYYIRASQVALVVKNPLANVGGEGNGNPLQYSCLENPVDRGVWWAAVHRVAQSRTRLKQLSMPACIGEGKCNPLQYSSLENLRDRGAWWATVYEVSQSLTRLKRLSSSSSVKGIIKLFYKISVPFYISTDNVCVPISLYSHQYLLLPLF